jgi:putative transposase
VGGEERAYDGGQEGQGPQKRHLLVDTEGLVPKAKVHSAKVMDFERGSRRCFGELTGNFPASLTCGWTQGTVERVKAQRLGQEDPGVERGSHRTPQRKPAPEGVMLRWAAEWAKAGVAVDWQKLMPPKGFVVLPRRWVVERTIAWIEQNRRMSLATTRGSYVQAAKRWYMLP